MANFDVKITGLDSLISKLQKAPDKIMSETKSIIDNTVLEIQSKAKGYVPVKTGKLRSSITHRNFDLRQGATISAGNIGVKYAAYVEFGTGTKFQIPVYPNVNMNDLESYAATFKRRKRVIGVPHRPFMFLAFNEEYGKMLYRIRKIGI